MGCVLAIAPNLHSEFDGAPEPAALEEGRIPGNVWQSTTSPAAEGFDAEGLRQAHQRWEASGSAAFFVVVDGVVIVAWGDVERRFMCHSVRKSLLSALIGVHVDEGTIDCSKTLRELDIDDVPPLLDSERLATVEHLLMARSGIYRPAAYEPQENAKPERGAHAPGDNWCYNNWDFNTLATVLQQCAGVDLFEDFDRRIAQPLGMEDFRPRDGYYHFERDKSMHPAYPFRMSTRDLARFGLLFLRGGMWGDARIVSEDWVRKSTTSYSPEADLGGYGYMWWTFDRSSLHKYGLYGALGDGGHLVGVLPALDMVVVSRADTYSGDRVGLGSIGAVIKAVIDARIEPAEGGARTFVPLRPAPTTRKGSSLDAERSKEICGVFPLTGIQGREPAEIELVQVERIERRTILSSPILGHFEVLEDSHGELFLEDALETIVWVTAPDGARSVSSHHLMVEAAYHHRLVGRFALAQALLEEAILLSPTSTSAWRLLGEVLIEDGAYGEGRDALATALEHGASVVQIATFVDDRGNRLLAAGNTAAAVATLEVNVKLIPAGFATVRRSLAKALVADGRPAEAMEVLEENVKLFPNDAEAAALLAELRGS